MRGVRGDGYVDRYIGIWHINPVDQQTLETPQNPFASMGLESIGAIISNATKDRQSSIKTAGDLTSSSKPRRKQNI